MPTATVNGFEMNYRVSGAGPPLVMAHGLLGSMATMAVLGDVSDLLTDSFTVVNYDARGHGLSGHTTDPADYHWRGLAADMHALLEHLGVERAFVGGGSMGAGTSIVFALEHPEMVQKLVLMLPPPLDRQEFAVARNTLGGLATLIESVGLEKAVDIAVRLYAEGAPQPFPPEMAEWMRQWLLAQNAEGIVAAIRGVVDGPDLPVERFGEIRAPTLVIGQPGDEIHPLTSAERVHKAIAGSRLVVAPDRMYYTLHRDELARIIREFLLDAA
ncbi:MAG: alpha/beta hydrolase [Dehalococcoidia bacterium]|nr:alpha/beta hydrolase [Dehalococcoidia bacterium]